MDGTCQNTETTDVRNWDAKPPMVAIREIQSFADHAGVGTQRGERVNDAARCAGCATRGDYERVTRRERLELSRRALEDRRRTVGGDDLVGPQTDSQRATHGWRHPLVEWQHRVALLPSTFDLGADPRPGRQIKRDETWHQRHARSLDGLSSAVVTTARQWILGARPRTLTAAVAPVLVGSATAMNSTSVESSFVINGLLALAVSLALQLAVNYANDYSDGVRGTDSDRRGPRRLVASGDASARAVRFAALLCFGVAAIAGVVLAARTSWWLVPVGLMCIVAGWTYTGGPKPYGYAGLGECFVFVFFGLIATAGTTYVAGGGITALSVLAGAMSGFLAVALLLVNNIRDIDGDKRSGKRTLAVRLGPVVARRIYVGCFAAVACTLLAAATYDALALMGVLGLLAALPAVSTVRSAPSADRLIAALGMTARVQLVVSILYSLGVAIQ